MIATAQRGRRVGHAQSADIERLARIGPHIQRTMRLNLLIGYLNSRLAAAYDALDCMDHGVCLLSSGGRIVFANRVARDFSQSRDVVWLGRERLETDTRSGKASLDGAIGAACSPLDALPRSGSVRLEKRDGRPLIVHVIALSERVRGRLVGAPAVLVLIHDQDRKRGMTASDLGAVFELTVTEGEIAVALGEGLTQGEICAVRGIGLNTLKTHRRRIFEKLGVASQSALVRLLNGF